MFSISFISSVWTSILNIILAIMVLLLMVLIHELGHYTAGKILKFKINEFSIGFGKAIFSKTNKHGEKISLRIFPLGGYCAFAGENDIEKVDTNPDSFNNQKPWKRIIVFLAGVTFNLVSAVIFSFIMLISYGFDIQQISNTNVHYPNEFQAGDIIYEIGGTSVDFSKGDTLQTLIAQYNKDEEFEVRIKRNGEMQTITAKLVQEYEIERNEDGTPIYDEYGNTILKLDEGLQPIPVLDGSGNPVLVIGIVTNPYPHTFVEALARCIPFTFGLVRMVLESFWKLITFQLDLNSIGGPIATISTIAQITEKSLASLLFLMPLIAANLGVFNLLPFPALDGSHVLFTLIEWIRRKPINRKVEAYIHFAGLIILFTFIIIVDIVHFFT